MKIEIEVTSRDDRSAKGTWSVSHECYQQLASDAICHVACLELGAEFECVLPEIFGDAGLIAGVNETSGTWFATW